MQFSLVISTLGRTEDLALFLESMRLSTNANFEVIIVDQNSDGRLYPVVKQTRWPFPVIHLHVPEMRGASRGRNHGAQIAKGDYIAFPDDDCTYPPVLLEKVLESFKTVGADIVTGRAAAPDGRSINGRFIADAEWVGRTRVFTTQIEWMMFFRMEVFKAVGGFDVDVGVGASTPWQSAEAQDITLRALDAGYTCYYDPALFGHHPELDIYTPDKKMLRKARAYGCGMGYVLAKHRLPAASVLNYLARPALGCALFAVKFKFKRSAYYFNSGWGRLLGLWDGYRQKV